MTARAFLTFLEAETKNLRQAGLVRPELELRVPPGPIVRIGEQDVVSFLSSDYLGLSGHAALKQAAIAATEEWGVGFASPRAQLGTVTLHAELEASLKKLLGTEDALVFASGHHANAGLFEALLSDRDYIFYDEMIRPSLADGVRLSRARGHAYRNNDMEHLEDRLKRSRAARFRIIATDGVFPVTGRIANLTDIYALASKYQATVVVDDTQGLGVLGDAGQGSHAFAAVSAIDLVTGSFGGALGGGAGGFVAGKSTILTYLRQKSRSHLASTALAPSAMGAAKKAIEIVGTEPQLRKRLAENLRVFRDAVTKDAGVIPEVAHPAVSVLIRNAVLAQRLTDILFRERLFVMGYCHPVVPEGEARISLRITVRHDPSDLERAAKVLGDGMKMLKVQL